MPQEPEDELVACQTSNKLIKYIAGAIATIVTTGIISIWQTIQQNTENLVRLDERTTGVVEELIQLNKKIDTIYVSNKTEFTRIENRVNSLDNRIHTLEISKQKP
jgi:hypothetical protein